MGGDQIRYSITAISCEQVLSTLRFYGKHKMFHDNEMSSTKYVVGKAHISSAHLCTFQELSARRQFYKLFLDSYCFG